MYECVSIASIQLNQPLDCIQFTKHLTLMMPPAYQLNMHILHHCPCAISKQMFSNSQR